jgi:hypothetical protein
MAKTCPDLDFPGSLWSFYPNLGAAYALIVLFALTTIIHILQTVLYKKPYCWVIILSGTA